MSNLSPIWSQRAFLQIDRSAATPCIRRYKSIGTHRDTLGCCRVLYRKMYCTEWTFDSHYELSPPQSGWETKSCVYSLTDPLIPATPPVSLLCPNLSGGLTGPGWQMGRRGQSSVGSVETPGAEGFTKPPQLCPGSSLTWPALTPRMQRPQTNAGMYTRDHTHTESMRTHSICTPHKRQKQINTWNLSALHCTRLICLSCYLISQT